MSVLTYNADGNSAEDWSTNAPPVQALGRQMSYLQPDVVTFQEIPYTNTWQMADFVRAFLTGYSLATNSCTDGYIRSVILSRFPIVRSQSWLCHASLADFGYAGTMTRDLFEAEIAVPGFDQPVHVFTTHLKAGQDGTSSARRAAEANAISNFLVTVFLPVSGAAPYLLTGDLNEDIFRPPASNPQTLQRLVNLATGLRLTSPTNPLTASELTYSIRSGLTKRYDYILPGELLFSNVAGSQVFRTDVLAGPPAPLQSNDDATTSDHLPVLVVFRNPYDTPFRLLSLSVSNQLVTLHWASAAGDRYGVEGSSDLRGWTPLATHLPAAGTHGEWTTNLPGDLRFFRAYREP